VELNLKDRVKAASRPGRSVVACRRETMNPRGEVVGPADFKMRLRNEEFQ